VIEHLSLAGSGGDQWGFKVNLLALVFRFTN
jgi:hypothetical protein